MRWGETLGELSRKKPGWGCGLCSSSVQQNLQQEKSWGWQDFMEPSHGISVTVGSEHSNRWGRNQNSHILPLDNELSVPHLPHLPGLSQPPR